MNSLLNVITPVLINLCGVQAPPAEYAGLNAPVVAGIKGDVQVAKLGNDTLRFTFDCHNGKHLTVWFAVNVKTKMVKLTGVSEQTEAEKAAAKELHKKWLKDKSFSI